MAGLVPPAGAFQTGRCSEQSGGLAEPLEFPSPEFHAQTWGGRLAEGTGWPGLSGWWGQKHEQTTLRPAAVILQ